jgi:hypothetical protein
MKHKKCKLGHSAITYKELIEDIQDIVGDYLVKIGCQYGGRVDCVLDHTRVNANLYKSISTVEKIIKDMMRRDSA